MKNKFLAVIFAVTAVIGFSQLASAQSLQFQAREAAVQASVQTSGLGLSLGEAPVVTSNCPAGSSNIFKTWKANGATTDQAEQAATAYFSNCMCATYGAQYCK